MMKIKELFYNLDPLGQEIFRNLAMKKFKVSYPAFQQWLNRDRVPQRFELEFEEWISKPIFYTLNFDK
jgi:hypothetical protein